MTQYIKFKSRSCTQGNLDPQRQTRTEKVTYVRKLTQAVTTNYLHMDGDKILIINVHKRQARKDLMVSSFE